MSDPFPDFTCQNIYSLKPATFATWAVATSCAAPGLPLNEVYLHLQGAKKDNGWTFDRDTALRLGFELIRQAVRIEQ